MSSMVKELTSCFLRAGAALARSATRRAAHAFTYLFLRCLAKKMNNERELTVDFDEMVVKC